MNWKTLGWPSRLGILLGSLVMLIVPVAVTASTPSMDGLFDASTVYAG